MPSARAVLAFAAEIDRQLTEPIRDYYAALDIIERTHGPFAEIRRRIALERARRTLREVMDQRLQTLILQAGIVGNNGQPLTNTQWAVVQRAYDEQARYMQGFMAAIPTLTQSQAEIRARSYSSAIIQAISRMASADMPFLPHYPGDKDLACKGYCKCHLDIEATDGGWDVYWVLGDAEHCEDCLRLSAEWRPLQIRNGQIVGMKALSTEQHKRLIALGLIAYTRLN